MHWTHESTLPILGFLPNILDIVMQNFLSKAARLAAVAAMAATTGLAHASGAETRLEFGAVTKTMTELHTAPGRSNLYLVAEGAGKFSVGDSIVPVYVLCGAVDTIVEGHKSVYAGVGDCEFKSAAGGILFARFQTPEGKGDRARMVLSGGTADLARFNGKAIPMIAILNPRLVGKAVFYFDSVDAKVIDQ
jgi:hypothetical protein